ncbi:hypothetical protein B0H19DRAFT_1294700 [Mycena capillaripes]|nr:hypothetical protein B0H19DRAFT_1294700 [Mycena capillaripes]
MSSDSALIDAFRPLRAALIPAAYVELVFNGFYSGLYIMTVYALTFKRETHGFKWGIFLALTSMIDIMIWRCWTMWNRNWKIITLPLTCTMVGAGLGFRSIAAQVAFVHDPLSSPTTYIDFGNAYFGLILATTISATFLILFRIYKMSEKSTRKSMKYGRVIEMVVESAALYLVALVVYIPLSIRGEANVAYPQALVAQLTVGCLTRTNLPHTEVAQGITPTLLVARVAFGLAHPDTTWHGESTMSAFCANGNSTSEQPSTIFLSSVSRSEHSGTKFEAIHDV